MIKANVSINDEEFKQCGAGKFSGYYASEDGRINGRVVYQFEYDGGKAKLVQKFNSINGAATNAGVSFTTMRGWAKNPTKEHNGSHYILSLN